MEEFRATFRIGEKEAVAFNLYQAVRTRYVGVLGFALLGLIMTYLYGSTQIQSPVVLALSMILSFVMAASLTMVGVLISVRARVRKALRHDPTADAEQHIVINGFGVRTECNGKEVRIGFEKIHSVRETGKAFYLYLRKDKAWILPKAQMDDPKGDSAKLRKIFDMVIPSASLHFKK